MNTSNMFSPIKLGPYTLPNRIVMAPLTRNRAAAGNVAHSLNAEYYAQRATAGFIISEAAQISPQGVGYPSTPGIHSEEQIAGWQLVTRAVHEKGGHIFLQLWHVGRISHPSMQPDNAIPIAPSAVKPAGNATTYDGPQPFEVPRAMELDEISPVIDQFRQAAENAMRAGFDGVELHAANGYIIDQFLRSSTNQRTDEYGGSIENRMRLLREVTEAITGAVGADKVGVRLSPENTFNDIHDDDPQTTFNHAAEMLSHFGLAYLHVLEGDTMTAQRIIDYRQIKERFGGLYIANSGYNLQRAQDALNNGDTDMVSFGALYIANPDLVARFEKHASLNTPDVSTYYGGDEKGYLDYAFL